MSPAARAALAYANGLGRPPRPKGRGGSFEPAIWMRLYTFQGVLDFGQAGL